MDFEYILGHHFCHPPDVGCHAFGVCGLLCFIGPRVRKIRNEASKFVCLFVCSYKTRESLLRLPPWARSKNPGSISTRAV